MKKMLAVLLSVVMAMCLMAPAFAAAAPEAGSLGIIGGADGPTAIITTGPAGGRNWMNTNPEFDKAGLQAYQAMIDAQKEALGGVAGQIGVMVNGKYIKFPGAAPETVNGRTMVPVRALVEALGGGVDYEFAGQKDTVRLFAGKYTVTFTIGGTEAVRHTRGTDTGEADKTIEMDCAPYIKDGSTYVPVRFIAGALDYEVGWDSDFQTVILLDRDALAAEIDKDFTILNRAQASRGPAIGEGGSSLTDTRCSLAVTVFDTLNGNKTYRADMTGQTLMNAEAINGAYSFTLSGNVLDDLEALLTSVYGEAFEENAALVRAVAAGMEDMEVIMTREGMVYAHAPILDELTGKENVWSGMDMGAELGTLFSAQPDAATVGSILAGFPGAGSVMDWSTMEEMVQMMAALYSDDKFTTSNGVSTITIGLEELAALSGADADEVKDAFKEYKITMKVDGRGGVTAVCTMETRAQSGVPGIKLTMNSAQSAGKAKVTMTIHMANIGELKLTAFSTGKAASGTPKTEPPEGAAIIDAGSPEL